MAWIPDQSTGPQLGLSLLRGKDHDTICLVVNHAVMDGRGFKDYLALLARLYNGEGDGDMGRGRRDLYGALKSYRGTGPSAGSRPAGPRSLRAGPRTRSALLMPPSASEPRGRARLFRWQGSLAALDSLRARPEETLAAARALPATINDLLIAAAAAAIARALPLDRGQPIEVAFMVDMRRYDREAMLSPYCNASSTESLWIDPWNRELGELIADIAGQTAAIKEGQPGLRGLRQLKAARRFLPRPLFEAVLKRRIRASTLATTNLGHLDPAALRFGGAAAVDAFVVTALKEDPALQFSLSTFGEKLTITSYGSWSAENEAKVAAIFDSLSSILAPP